MVSASASGVKKVEAEWWRQESSVTSSLAVLQYVAAEQAKPAEYVRGQSWQMVQWAQRS